jgi:hypothetical protein
MRFFLTRLCTAQDPGLSPATLFSTVFFNQLAANLKNATNLLRQLRAENASLVVNTNGPRERPGCIHHHHTFIHSFFLYTPSNPQIRCVAADSLWQPSSLRCLVVSSTILKKMALQM